MSAPQIIRNLHLPGIPPFAYATAIQNNLVRQNLDYKAVSSPLVHPHPLPPVPPPTILSFSPSPVYTTGRRELGTLSAETIRTLQQPLEPRAEGPRHPENVKESRDPEVRETLRGGQITFHGPGQLVIYPIFDLRSVKNARWPKGLSPRCYVNVLEEATINTLKTFGIAGLRTSDPGVWVSETSKIAALGVHLRRNITNYGVGLNVLTDLRYFDRIVACGLEGKITTSIMQELYKGMTGEQWVIGRANALKFREKARYMEMRNRMELGNVAKIWGREFVKVVWGEEGLYKQSILSSQRDIAEFLDRGEGRIMETLEDVRKNSGREFEPEYWKVD